MYTRNNKNGKILNILLGIIALFIIIFIIAWVVNKGANTSNYDAEFKDNLEKMHETAKDYFADELPEEIGDTTLISLDEMYNLELSEELSYGKTVCDETLSYISITKINKSEYKVKSNLVCGSKSDNIVEKIQTNTIIEDENENIIIDEEKDNVDLDVNKGNSSNNNGTGSSNNNSTVDCFGPVCTFIQIETTCKTTYEYEFVKRNVSCPAGYTYSNGTCVSIKDEVISSTPNYSDEKVVVEDAKVNEGSSYRRYTDPIVSGGEKYSYCTEGTLKNGYCYTYANKEVSTSEKCPDGYTREGNSCFKYTDLISSGSTSCPSGYEPKNNACYKYADLITDSKTTYSCPNGYTEVGSGSSMKCLKTASAVKKYTEWGNPDRIYSTSTKESTYTNELSKKVLVGTNKVGVTTVYNYAVYSRTSYYYCAQGTLSGTKCNIYTDATKNSSSNSYCPSGYTQSGNTCYIKKDLTYTDQSYCPSGYTRKGTTNICYDEEQLITNNTATCPKGYTDNGNNCYKKTTAKTGTTAKTYKCPSGYNSIGSGSSIECFKTYYSDDTYYCENADATLKETKCYLTVPSQYIGSSCPTGYTPSGENCVRSTTITANPIWSNAEIIYSSSTYLEGYQRTGVAKFVTKCTPVNQIHYK